MIEVITEGRVIKFDKEKKIIAFLNIKKMKKRNVFWEIPLEATPYRIVDYPDTYSGIPFNRLKELAELQRSTKTLIERIYNA